MDKECKNCLYYKRFYCFLEAEYKESKCCCQYYKSRENSTNQDKKDLILAILRGSWETIKREKTER
jgi:hypothetical protein